MAKKPLDVVDENNSKREDDVLRRMLKTPPNPHAAPKATKPKKPESSPRKRAKPAKKA